MKNRFSVRFLRVAVVLLAAAASGAWTASLGAEEVETHRTNPAIAYDPIANRHLTVYTYNPGSGGDEVRGRFVDAAGAPVGTEIAIAAAGYAPDVACDVVNGRFLVVWSWPGIHGRLFDTDGAPLGPPFEIIAADADHPDARTFPSVAFDAVNGQYLVVWADGREAWGPDYNRFVYGQRVAADGDLIGTEILISSAPRSKDHPAVAFDAGRQLFLVAWEDSRNETTGGTDIYAQLVRANGALAVTGAEANLAVAGASSPEREPAVAVDSDTHTFFVAFSREVSGQWEWDIFGRTVAADGSAGRLFPVSQGEGVEYYSAAAYRSADRRFLVVFSSRRGQDDPEGYDLAAQWVAGYGAVGEPFPLATVDEVETTPAAAYNPLCDNMVVAYGHEPGVGHAVAWTRDGDPCPSVVVSSPNGGEQVDAGATWRIRWSGTPAAASYRVSLSTDNRRSWSVLERAATETFLDWQAPVPIANREQCFVRVEALRANGTRIASDLSDGAFTIRAIGFTWPPAGAPALSGQVVDISWDLVAPGVVAPASLGADGEVASVVVSYTLNGGRTWKKLGSVAVHSGDPLPTSVPWTVPQTVTPKTRCRVKVVMNNAAGRILASALSPFFTIASVLLVSPNGGETIASGGTHEISWESAGAADAFALSYSTDGGRSWKPIASGVAGSRYSWDVPAAGSNRTACKVRVVGSRAATGAVVGRDDSDRRFSVNVVRVLSPNGAELWKGGGARAIGLEINGTVRELAKVRLRYTVDGGRRWSPLGEIALGPGDPAPESLLWDPLPSPASVRTKCKVLVGLEDATGRALGSDTSDGWFAIEPP